jgi:hypothetical protein
MSCTVRDASLVTLRNRNKMINAYAQSFKTATMNTSNANASLVQGPVGGQAQNVANATLGCMACTTYDNFVLTAINGSSPDPNQTLYPFNPSSGGASRNGPSGQ